MSRSSNQSVILNVFQDPSCIFAQVIDDLATTLPLHLRKLRPDKTWMLKRVQHNGKGIQR